MKHWALPTTVVCADRQRAKQVVQLLEQVDRHWAKTASIIEAAEAATLHALTQERHWLPIGLLIVDAAVVDTQSRPLWRELLAVGGLEAEEHDRALVVLVESAAAELEALTAGAIDALIWSALQEPNGAWRLRRSLQLAQRWLELMERRSRSTYPNAPHYAQAESLSTDASSEALTGSLTPSSSWFTVLDRVLEHTVDGIVIVNQLGVIFYANPAACQLFGRAKSALIGSQLGIPIGTERATEMEILRSDGSVGVGELNVSMVDWMGESAYVVAIRDVSYRKQVESDLRYRLGLESVVAYVARLLVTADDDVRFGSVLESIGRAMRVDRVLLLHGPGDQPLMNLACEWYDKHQSPVAKALTVPGRLPPKSWIDRLQRDRAIIISSLDQIPTELHEERLWLSRLDAQAVIITAIRDRKEALWGALVLCVREPRPWLKQDVQLLQTIGDTIFTWYDRQATQDRLRASEALYASIFERSDDRIFLIEVRSNGDFAYETVNPAFERAMERPASQIIGRSPRDLFPDSCAIPIIARFRACIAGRDTVRCEELLILRGCPRIWHTSLVPIRDAWNRVIKILGSARDITQEREATLQRENQSRYRQLLASIAFKIRQSLDIQVILGRTVSELQKTLRTDRALFYRCHPDGICQIAAETVSPPFSQLASNWICCCGLTFKNIIPDLTYYWQGNILQIDDMDKFNLDPEQYACISSFNILAQLIVPVTISTANLSAENWGFVPQPKPDDHPSSNTVLLGLLCLQQCSQARAWSSFEVDLLQQLAGQLSIALYQARLLEERTSAVEGLARSNEQLQQFAYVASHDLQEPLRGAIAFAEMLHDEYSDRLDETAQEYLKFVIDSCLRMRQLIRDLLTYSRVETRGQNLTVVDCNQVLAIVLENLHIAIRDSRATIQADPLPNIWADAMQITQLFQNLIGNALKFRGNQDPIVTITAQLQNQQWHFQVRDNGIGISPEYVDRIFNIFQRLHSREEYEGTGIGLAICRKIVERHGGTIGVTSEIGQGAEFWFTLPDLPEQLSISAVVPAIATENGPTQPTN
jgi:PAS domain S-box-containing protein